MKFIKDQIYYVFNYEKIETYIFVEESDNYLTFRTFDGLKVRRKKGKEGSQLCFTTKKAAIEELCLLYEDHIADYVECLLKFPNKRSDRYTRMEIDKTYQKLEACYKELSMENQSSL